jgi:hypothetical protein
MAQTTRRKQMNNDTEVREALHLTKSAAESYIQIQALFGCMEFLQTREYPFMNEGEARVNTVWLAYNRLNKSQKAEVKSKIAPIPQQT